MQYSTPAMLQSWRNNEAIGRVAPHLTLNISMSRRSVLQIVSKKSNSIFLKLETIFFQANSEVREAAWYTMMRRSIPAIFLPGCYKICLCGWSDWRCPSAAAAAAVEFGSPTLWLYFNDVSVGLPAQLRASVCPGHMHETPCFNLPSGTLQPQTATDYFTEAFEGKTRVRTEADKPESTRERRTSQSPGRCPVQVQFSFHLWPRGLYILLVTKISGRQKIKSSSACIFMSIWKSSRGTSFSLSAAL